MTRLFLFLLSVSLIPSSAKAGIDEAIKNMTAPLAVGVGQIVFFKIPFFGAQLPAVVLWLIIGAVFFTIYMRFAKQNIPVLPVHDSFITIRGLFSELVNVMYEEFEKMFHLPINIDSKPMMPPQSNTPENLDTEWIISEIDKYRSWTDRNPL